MAHDEKSECRVGDWVRIQQTRPLSARKRWRVIKVLNRAVVAETVPEANA
ncbi:MAG: small ribosomal subunit protein uS17 [Terriglobia bacterium]